MILNTTQKINLPKNTSKTKSEHSTIGISFGAQGVKVDALFREGDTGIYYTALYFFAAVILAILLCIVIVLIKFHSSSKKTSTIVYYVLRLLSLCTVLLITIGPIPLFQTFLEALVCEADDPLVTESECYKGIHLANTICGALALFFTLGLTIISQMLFIDFNPASKIPFAGPQSIIGFFKLALKFGITLYYTLDHDVKNWFFKGIYDCLVVRCESFCDNLCDTLVVHFDIEI